MALVQLKKELVLASKSPRRQQLLKDLGFDFEIRTKEIEEIYPEHLKRESIAIYLSELKSAAFYESIGANEIVITSDTIVCLGDQVIGKPIDRSDSINMLRKLSGQKHEVITGVTLLSKEKKKSFYCETAVYFRSLTDEEIIHYIDTYEPFDKAGSYGIQEWIGYIGVEKIVGSYYNVMGLPVKELYDEITKF